MPSDLTEIVTLLIIHIIVNSDAIWSASLPVVRRLDLIEKVLLVELSYDLLKSWPSSHPSILLVIIIQMLTVLVQVADFRARVAVRHVRDRLLGHVLIVWHFGS